MSENKEVVGEVRVKVRPDSEDFRREAGREVDQAVRGLRGEVPLDGKLRVNTQQLQQQLNNARQRLKGGDVKIVATLETNASKALEEWGKASDKVKATYKSIEDIERRYIGKNKARGDELAEPLRKRVNQLSVEAGRLRKLYEEISDDTRLAQSRDNLRIAESGERLENALEANTDLIRKMTAAELQAYRERTHGTEAYFKYEEEFQRRLAQLRLNGHWDHQRKQAQNNAEIERENRRHQMEMSKRFDLQGMPEDAEQWSTQELIRAQHMANKGLIDEANAVRIMAEVRRRLRQAQLENSLDPTRGMRAAANKASLQQYLQSVDNANIEREWQKIRDEAKKTTDYIDEQKPILEIQERGLIAMAAQLKWASRPRHVPFYVTVNQKSLAIAEGMLKSLSGLNSLQQVGRWAETLLVDFDKVSVKGAAVSTVLASIANTVAYMTTAAFPIAADILKLTGGLALLPTALGSVAANMVIHTAAFKNFQDAVDGDVEALEALPPTAREAAESLQGLWDEVSRPIQDKFWEGMGDEFARTIEILKDPMTAGLADTALGFGIAWAGVADSIQDLALRGDLERMLGNMAEGALIAANAANPLADAINTLGLRGSEYLPDIAGWVRDVANQFNNWIQSADDAGRINFWIERAHQQLEQLWDIGGSTVDIFYALDRVATNAGAGGLAGFADSLDRIAQKMQSDLWQSRMSTILEGARSGASNLNVGFLNLSNTIGAASGPVSEMLELLGALGGGTLTGISKTFGQVRLQGGILDSLNGMNGLIDDLGPSFENLGEILGIFGTLAGSVFGELGPLFNDVFDVVSDIVAGLEDDLLGLIPVLGLNLRKVVELISGPLEALFDVVGDGITLFSEMPSVAQAAILSMLAFPAMRTMFAGLFDTIGNGGRRAFGSLITEGQKAPRMLDPLRLAWREQVRLVERLDHRTMGFATSVEHVGRGRAALGNLAAGFAYANDAAGKFLRTGEAMSSAEKQMRAGWKDAGSALREGYSGAFRAAGEFRDGIREGFRQVGQEFAPVRDGFARMGDGIRGATDRGVQGFRMLGQEARIGAIFASESVKQAFAPMGQAMQPGIDRMRRGLQSVVDAAAPVRTSLGNIGSGLGGAATTMTRHFGSIADSAGRAATSIGRSASGGLRLAVGGLAGALGGGWGIAIMGAIALMGSFAAKSAEAKQKVEGLKATLNEDGSYSADTVKRIADAWTDLDEVGDPIANNMRGAKAANETAQALGQNLADVTKSIINGGPAFHKYADGLQAIADKKNFNWRQGPEKFAEVSAAADAATKSLNLNAEAVDGLSAKDIQHYVDNIRAEEAALRASELAWKGIAEAQGTTIPVAQAMAQAMQTIGDDSISAAGKIDAIRTALDLLKGGTMSAQEAQMNAAKIQQSAVEQAKGLAEEIAVSKDLLFDADGMLSSSSAIGIKVYDIIKSSADGLLIEAQAAFDAAKAKGETDAVAAEKALAIMEKSDGRLQELADSMGIEVGTLKAQWETFFGEDWQLSATFSANADQVQVAAQLAKEAGLEFNGEEFMAWLLAQPDPAKVTTDEITSYMHGKLGEKFNALLEAIPEPARATLAALQTEVTSKWTDAMWKAKLEAIDQTAPGTSAAVHSIMQMTGMNYSAAIQAINATRGGLTAAEIDLMNLSDEQVAILSAWAGIPPPPPIAPLRVAIQPVYDPVAEGNFMAAMQRRLGGGSEDGSIWDGKSSMFSGMFPMSPVPTFLNGGFLEQPGPAKIYKPASTYRIFAERATGGEAYIPLAASKRDRSIDIWKETGKRLGVYEDGGIDGAGRLVGRLAGGADQRPINITINGVRMDYAQETASTIMTALKRASRG